MKTETLTKQESKALLIHATNASSTTEVAKILGVPSPRISEGKGGRWQLNKEQISTLIDSFGPPKAVQGFYAEAELFNSFDEFKDDFQSDSTRLQLQRVLASIYSKPCQEFLLRSVILADSSHEDERTVTEEKHRIINELIYHPSFERWHTLLKSKPFENQHDRFPRLDQARFINLEKLSQIGFDAAVNTYGDSWEIEPGSLMEIIKSLGAEDIRGIFGPSNADKTPDAALKRRIGPTSSPYYLIGEIVHSYQEIAGLLGFPLPAKVIFNGHSPMAGRAKDTQEVVITGDIVYELDNEMLPIRLTCKDYFSLFLDHEIRHYRLNPLEGLRGVSDYGFNYLGPVVYSHLSAKLFLSKSLSYHFYFELYNQAHSQDSENYRSIMIEGIPGDKVFQFLEDFRAHFYLEKLPVFNIKKGVAAKGGFIPGARYVE